MLDFSVIGLGSVGWAVIHGLHSKGFTYAGYDIIGDHDWSKILKSKVAFICSSTPSGTDGKLDCSSVWDILCRLNKNNYSNIVVIKSTLSIGFMDEVTKKLPNLRLVYMPEFLRERSCYTWFLDPDRLVVSGSTKDVKGVLKLFEWIPKDKIIHTKYIDAEIGKLAHNSYIATKVSFTNDIERICGIYNADPRDTMKIVWTDRRVNCAEHLTPLLGPYGGKCVVKDMKELMVAGNSDFLRSVERVNNLVQRPEANPTYSDVDVIIPTNHGIDFLFRALRSVINQTYKPKTVVVVSDKSADYNLEIRQLIKDLKQLEIMHIINDGPQNVSGAINTGLRYLTSKRNVDSNSFIALLDDDDWWENRYLENCIKFAYEYK